MTHPKIVFLLIKQIIDGRILDEQENVKYIWYDLVNVLPELLRYNKQEFAMVLPILPTIVDPRLNFKSNKRFEIQTYT